MSSDTWHDHVDATWHLDKWPILSHVLNGKQNQENKEILEKYLRIGPNKEMRERRKSSGIRPKKKEKREPKEKKKRKEKMKERRKESKMEE